MPDARRLLALPVVALVATAGLAACGSGDTETEPAPSPSVSSSPSPTPDFTAAPAPAPSAPVSVSIPSIGVERDLIDLGIAATGELEVPEDFADVGWFAGGGRPGGPGPTVIAGHVDSRSGPAVFFRLDELEVGDAVVLQDTSGVVHEYRVTEIATAPKDEFPTAAVFGSTPDDVVRLITCTGPFDSDARSYTDNLVVTAARV